MRQIFFKKTDNQIVEFQTNLTTFELSQEDPYGVEYREQCSSTLDINELNEWWDYVDQLRDENPITDFHSVWKIIDNDISYGYIN
jgi:hypothetical protein